MKAPKNFVFYKGPSMLDGEEIVAIATIGESASKANSKTGVMVQTWILRADVDPVKASKTGLDVSICGFCPYRGVYGADGMRTEGSRACYVQLYVPANVWHTWIRGSYDDLSLDLEEGSNRVQGRMLRLGSYGDPAAVPFGVWLKLVEKTEGHAGYTHQWQQFPTFSGLCMASVDSEADKVYAKLMGFRTFRVAPAVNWTKEGKEVICAASKEAGFRTTCNLCRACGGTSSKARADIVIPAHGTGRNLI